MSPGRKPSRSPASTAGRTSTMRRTASLVSASTAAATARNVLPVPAGPMPNVRSRSRIARVYATWCGPRARMLRRRVLIVSPPSSPPDESSASLRMCSASAMCTRSGSSSSVAASSNRSSSTRLPRRVASSSPTSSKRLPRLLILIASCRSIWRRCSSNWPERDASRRGSSGLRITLSECSFFAAASGNGLLRRAREEATPQRIAQRLRDQDVGETADERGVADEVHPPVVLGAAGELARRLRRRALDEDPLHRAGHRAADRRGLLVQERLEPLEPPLFHLARQVGQLGGRGAGPRAIYKGERLVEAYAARELERRLEI